MYLSIKINMSIGYDDTLTNKKIHLTTEMNCGCRAFPAFNPTAKEREFHFSSVFLYVIHVYFFRKSQKNIFKKSFQFFNEFYKDGRQILTRMVFFLNSALLIFSLLLI